MRNEPPGSDPKSVWRSQAPEGTRMSLLEIRQKVRKMNRNDHIGMVAAYAFCALIVVPLLVGAARRPEIYPKIGLGICVLYVLSVSYQMRKKLWPGRLPADAGLIASIEFHRRALEHKRDYFAFHPKISWLLFVGVGTILFEFWPWMFLLQFPVIWIVEVLVFRRGSRSAQTEIDKLDALMKDAAL